MKPYVPEKLPIEGLDFKHLFGLVGTANAELARYDGLLQGIVNPSVMLSPLTNEEAVLSSRIEGTQATVDDVLEQEAGLIRKAKREKISGKLLTIGKPCVRDTVILMVAPSHSRSSVSCTRSCSTASEVRIRLRANFAEIKTGSERTAARSNKRRSCHPVRYNCRIIWRLGRRIWNMTTWTFCCRPPLCMHSLNFYIPSKMAMVELAEF